MTAINEINLNDAYGDQQNTRQKDDSSLGQDSNPFTQAELPGDGISQSVGLDGDRSQIESSGENAGVWSSGYTSSAQPGPGDDDDDDLLDDDDELVDDDDDDSLIPIEGDDDDDSLLGSDEDEDVVPGTDMDDGDDLLDDDEEDADENDSGVNRSTTGNIGTDFRRDDGRTTGRMIDHEPGTGGI